MFIAHCNDSEKKALIKSIKPKSSSLILIGPEGDFTEKEVEACNLKNYINGRLGILIDGTGKDYGNISKQKQR